MKINWILCWIESAFVIELNSFMRKNNINWKKLLPDELVVVRTLVFWGVVVCVEVVMVAFTGLEVVVKFIFLLTVVTVNSVVVLV